MISVMQSMRILFTQIQCPTIAKYIEYFSLATIVCLAFLEEVLFRSWPYYHFDGQQHTCVSIISAGVFAAAHQLNFSLPLKWRAYYFAVHYIFASLFWIITNYNFWLGVLLHLVWNYTIINGIIGALVYHLKTKSNQDQALANLQKMITPSEIQH